MIDVVAKPDAGNGRLSEAPQPADRLADDVDAFDVVWNWCCEESGREVGSPDVPGGQDCHRRTVAKCLHGTGRGFMGIGPRARNLFDQPEGTRAGWHAQHLFRPRTVPRSRPLGRRVDVSNLGKFVIVFEWFVPRVPADSRRSWVERTPCREGGVGRASRSPRQELEKSVTAVPAVDEVEDITGLVEAGAAPVVQPPVWSCPAKSDGRQVKQRRPPSNELPGTGRVTPVGL